MFDRASQAVTADPEALLRRSLDLLQEGRRTLRTTIEPGSLDAYSIRLEDAAEDLRSAVLTVDPSRTEAPARERRLLLARSLRHQLSQFNALLDGWVRYLTGWHQIRECHEHGYTAAGAPSPASARVHARGEL